MIVLAHEVNMCFLVNKCASSFFYTQAHAPLLDQRDKKQNMTPLAFSQHTFRHSFKRIVQMP